MGALKPTTADTLASAARQLQYALDGSATTEEAFQKLYAAAEPQQQDLYRQLDNLLRSPESDAATAKNLRLSAFPALAWLLRQNAAPERSAAALFLEFRSHQSFSTAGVAVVWSEFAGFLSYLAAVLSVLIIVTGLYGLFVLPQIRSLYGGFGQELPELTAAMFGQGSALIMLTVGLAAALLLFLSWFVLQLRRQLRRYAPMPTGYQKVPVVGPATSAYNEYLWLSYTGLLRAAKMPVDQALKLAASRLAQPREFAGSTAATELAVAARLGKLEEEAQFQQGATLDAFLTALLHCRRRSRVVLTVLIYLLVATFVSGMYLPIFSLGSAI
jgi:hypothetical protein